MVVFLSHSYKDKEIVDKVAEFFELINDDIEVF